MLRWIARPSRARADAPGNGSGGGRAGVAPGTPRFGPPPPPWRLPDPFPRDSRASAPCRGHRRCLAGTSAARRRTARGQPVRRYRRPTSDHAGSRASATSSDGPGPPSRRSIASASAFSAPGRASTPDEIEHHATRLLRPELREQRGRPVAGRLLGVDLSLRVPARVAEQDRPPAVGDLAGDAAVAGTGRAAMCSPRAQPAAWWSSAYSSRSANAPSRSAGDPSPNTARIDGANTSARSRSIARTVRWRYTWRYMNSRAVRNISSAPMPGLVEREPALGHEPVAPEPLGVDRPHRHPGQVGVPSHVVQVVDGEHARQQRLEDADPARHRRVGERRLRDQERDPPRVDRLAVGERVPLRAGARRPPQPADERPQLALDDQLREVLVAQRLRRRAGGGPRAPGTRPGTARRRSARTARDPRRGGARPPAASPRPAPRTGRARPAPAPPASARSDGYSERPHSPASCMTPEAVREPRVLGGREHPARALELGDPAQALEPRRVEQVVLGDVLVRVAGGARLGGGQALGELDVPVDRVGDQVDGRERDRADPDRSGNPDPRRGGPPREVTPLVTRPDAEQVPVAGAPVVERQRGAVVLSRIVRQVLSSRRKRTSKSRTPAVWVWSRGSAPSHASVMELPAPRRGSPFAPSGRCGPATPS